MAIIAHFLPLVYNLRKKTASCACFSALKRGGALGSAGERWGTLERVPQTPQNFSEQIMIDGIRRSCPVPAFSYAPAWRLECRVLQNRLSRFCRVWRTRIDLPVPPGASPRRTPHPTHFQCRIPPSPRGCKGRSPLHKNNLSLPLPHRGRGGWGSILPLRGREGKKANQRQGRQATNRASLTPGQRRQGESIPPCPPPPSARDTPSPPPGFSQIQFEESSGGFGGLFQESPGVSPPPTKNAWLLPEGSSHAEGITFPVRPGSSGRTRYWRT